MTPRQKWVAANPEKIRAARACWRAANRQRELDKNAVWRAVNQEKHRRLINTWKSRNKGRLAESVRFRQAQKQNATPSWLTKAHREEMAALYTCAALLTECGYPTQVDHVVPLLGRNVRGLHVPWNLQLLPTRDNQRKGNRI